MTAPGGPPRRNPYRPFARRAGTPDDVPPDPTLRRPDLT